MSDLRPAIRSVVCYFFLNGFLFGVWASRIPSLRDKHTLGEQQIGLLLLFMGIGAVLSMGLTGRWCDTLGHNYIARRTAWLMSVTIPLLALAPSTTALALVMFLYGATGGALDMAMNGFGTEVESARGKSIMSRLHGTWSIGAGTGAATGVLAAYLGAGIGPHFITAAATAMVLLALADRSIWIRPASDPAQYARMFVLPGGRLARVGLVALVAFMSEGVVQDWGALYVVDRFQQSEAIGAASLVCFAVAMVSMRLGGDIVIDRFGPRRTVIFAACAGAAGSMLAVLAPVFWLVWAGFFVMGCGLALLAPVTFSEAARQKGVTRGHAMASVAILGYGGLLIGPPLIGGVAELFSLRHGFALVAILSVSLLFLARYFRDTPKKSPD